MYNQSHGTVMTRVNMKLITMTLLVQQITTNNQLYKNDKRCGNIQLGTAKRGQLCAINSFK